MSKVDEARDLLARASGEMKASRDLIVILGAENQRLHERCMRYRKALVKILAEEENALAREALEG